jgi:hypothetical protein
LGRLVLDNSASGPHADRIISNRLTIVINSFLFIQGFPANQAG